MKDHRRPQPLYRLVKRNARLLPGFGLKQPPEVPCDRAKQAHGRFSLLEQLRKHLESLFPALSADGSRQVEGGVFPEVPRHRLGVLVGDRPFPLAVDRDLFEFVQQLLQVVADRLQQVKRRVPLYRKTEPLRLPFDPGRHLPVEQGIEPGNGALGIDCADDRFLFISLLVRDQDQAGAGGGIIEVGKQFIQVPGPERIDVLGDDEALRRHEGKGLAEIHDLRSGRVPAVDRIEIEISAARLHDFGDNEVYRFLDQEFLLAEEQVDGQQLALFETGYEVGIFEHDKKYRISSTK